jgi:hypothetical protein
MPLASLKKRLNQVARFLANKAMSRHPLQLAITAQIAMTKMSTNKWSVRPTTRGSVSLRKCFLIDPTLEAAIQFSFVPVSISGVRQENPRVCTLVQIKAFRKIQQEFNATALDGKRSG